MRDDTTTARLCRRHLSGFTTSRRGAWITARFAPYSPCRCGACRDTNTATTLDAALGGKGE